jgi:hypothetical protein
VHPQTINGAIKESDQIKGKDQRIMRTKRAKSRALVLHLVISFVIARMAPGLDGTARLHATASFIQLIGARHGKLRNELYGDSAGGSSFLRTETAVSEETKAPKSDSI